MASVSTSKATVAAVVPGNGELETNSSAEVEIICSVCVELISDASENPALITLCGHAFHKKCLQDWFNTGYEDLAGPRPSGKCPLCKLDIYISDCRRFYPSMQEKLRKPVVEKQTYDKAVAEIETLKLKLQEAEQQKQPPPQPKATKKVGKTAKSSPRKVTAKSSPRKVTATATTAKPKSILRTTRSSASGSGSGTTSGILKRTSSNSSTPAAAKKKVTLKLPKKLPGSPKGKKTNGQQNRSTTTPAVKTRCSAATARTAPAPAAASSSSSTLSSLNGPTLRPRTAAGKPAKPATVRLPKRIPGGGGATETTASQERRTSKRAAATAAAVAISALAIRK